MDVLGSVEVAVEGDGTSPKCGEKGRGCLGRAYRFNYVALWRVIRGDHVEGGGVYMALWSAEGMLCGLRGRWLKVVWGVGPSLVDHGHVSGGGGVVGLSLDWSDNSPTEHLDRDRTVAEGFGVQQADRGEDSGEEHDGYGDADDSDDGRVSKAGPVLNCLVPFKKARNLHSGRYSGALLRGMRRLS